MTPFARRLRGVGSYLAAIQWWAIACLVAALATVVLIQVAGRNLGFYLSWVEDVAVLLLIWQVFLASPLAVRHGAHYLVDVIVVRRPLLDRVLTLLAALVIGCVALMLIWKGGELAWQLRFRVSGAGGISMLAFYAALPLSGALTLFHLTEVLVCGVLPSPLGEPAEHD